MHKTHSDLFEILANHVSGDTLAALQRDLVLLFDQCYEDWTA